MKNILFYLTLVKAMVGVAITCHGAEPLDMAILMPRPITAKPCEPLDLRILAAPIESRKVEPLDLSILIDTPKPLGTPAVKPSKKAVVTPELGKEVRGQPRPMAVTTDYDYPPRGHNWTHPGSIRQHVTQGVHAGKLTSEQILKMTESELLAWHSDDHEGRSHQPVKIEKQIIASTPKTQGKTWLKNGVMYFQHVDNVFREKPESGVCYCGGKCQCGDACPGGHCPSAKTAPVAAPRVAYQQQYGCPGGRCPTVRRR